MSGLQPHVVSSINNNIVPEDPDFTDIRVFDVFNN